MIREVRDYPKKGIVFRDITPLLKDPGLFGSCMDELAERLAGRRKSDYIARGGIQGIHIRLRPGGRRCGRASYP